MSKQVLLCIAFLCIALSDSYAQGRPTICGPNARMELLCSDACIICDIDGFQGRNSTQGRGDRPPNFCTSINHNIQWIGFLAASEILTIELSVSNCEAGTIPDGGLEAGVFEVIDCDYDNAIRMSNCDSDIRNNSSQDLRMTNLVPGKYYYLIIDGNNGDVCDYSVRVTEGTTKVPEVPSSGGIQGPQRVCEDTEFTYSTSYVTGAPYYDWTLNGDTLAGYDLLERSFIFDTAGIYTVCVTASNLCDTGPQECLSIEVGEFPPVNVLLDLCDNDLPVINGQIPDTSGTYTEVLTSSIGCDSTVIMDLNIRPTASLQLDTTICDGWQLPFDGRTLTTGGTYTADLQTTQGCDSTVTLTLTVEDCSYVPQVDPTSASCNGTFDGSLALSVMGGSPPYSATYQPVGGAVSAPISLVGDGTVEVITNLAPGDYAVTFTDGFDVEITVNTTIVNPSELIGTAIVSPRAPGASLSCFGGSDGRIEASANGGRAPYTFTWSTGDSGPVIDGLPAGMYELYTTDISGCADTTLAEITAPTAIDTFYLTLETCVGSPIDIGGQPRDQSGDYIVTYGSSLGCDSTVVYSLTVKPTLRTQIDTTLCEGWVYRFAGQDLSTPGTYTDELTAANGCDSTVVLNLSYSDCSFTANISTTEVTCYGYADGVIGIRLTGPAPPYNVFYSKRGDAGGGQRPLIGDGSLEEITGLFVGEYELTFTDGYGVEQTQMATIEEPSLLESQLVAEMNGQFEISCANGSDGVVEARAVGGTPAYFYEWSTGFTGSKLENVPAGNYELVLKDVNGCETSRTIELKEPAPLELGVEPDPLSCDQQQGGGVFVEFVGGGQGPYQLETGDRIYQDNSTYLRLAPGEHILTLVDAQGCTEQQFFTIEALEIPKVEVDPQVFVYTGDTVQLNAVAVGEGIRYEWSGPGGLSCTDCPNPIVLPTESGSYFITVTNDDGCEATERVQLYLRLRRDLYAPTAFSPNGDGRNDYFTVYASEEGSMIEELRVFDRWGSSVFSTVTVPAGEEQYGWDGTHQGQWVNPGVFVFYATVRLSDGTVEVVKGDVTVIR